MPTLAVFSIWEALGALHLSSFLSFFALRERPGRRGRDVTPTLRARSKIGSIYELTTWRALSTSTASIVKNRRVGWRRTIDSQRQHPLRSSPCMATDFYFGVGLILPPPTHGSVKNPMAEGWTTPSLHRFIFRSLFYCQLRSSLWLSAKRGGDKLSDLYVCLKCYSATNILVTNHFCNSVGVIFCLNVMFAKQVSCVAKWSDKKYNMI